MSARPKPASPGRRLAANSPVPQSQTTVTRARRVGDDRDLVEVHRGLSQGVHDAPRGRACRQRRRPVLRRPAARIAPRDGGVALGVDGELEAAADAGGRRQRHAAPRTRPRPRDGRPPRSGRRHRRCAPRRRRRRRRGSSPLARIRTSSPAPDSGSEVKPAAPGRRVNATIRRSDARSDTTVATPSGATTRSMSTPYATTRSTGGSSSAADGCRETDHEHRARRQER